ncbi:hypothetical protein H310_05356 [Aphanomyces invadans]|uniref:START domain-containing protein n=1 Tax=Aphanomyces invadans TaxID=157072 RepID=A0A024U9G7_9STRA|nr:hypothetical protein H310_05356 [Aphanomyces invadans]ETW02889.1 hypothetical protein H310_05356 [Aphanomyces invadans]RHY31599.1 hypothetical protein DYB32_003345 [Aphanomyces invadans]|eukprot:XP_008868273.1 hypothetical protein H310_05356 [Aphanomyces invadans]
MMAINPGFRPKVSLAQADQLRAVCKRSMQELLQMASACDAPDSRALHYTTMPPKTTNEDVMTLCVSATLHASLDDIQDIMLSRISRTRDSHEFAKATETHVKGSQLLMKINENLTLNWAMIESMSAVMRDRDFVYVQSREFRTINGRPTWISCTNSVAIDGAPPLDTSVYDIVRGGIYSSGYVFTEQPDHSVHAVYVLQVDFKGKSPRFMAKSTLKNWGNALGRIQAFFESRQLGRISDFILSDLQVKNYRLGMECHVCGADSFGILGKKPDNCRICGEVVCARCVEKKPVPLKHGPVNLSLCRACLDTSLSPECFSPTIRRVGSRRSISSSSSARAIEDNAPRRERIQEPTETILLPGHLLRKRQSSVSRSRRSISTELPPPHITKDIPDNLDVLNKLF